MQIVKRNFDERFVIRRSSFLGNYEYRGSDGYWWGHYPEEAESFATYEAALAKFNALNAPPKPSMHNTTYTVVYQRPWWKQLLGIR